MQITIDARDFIVLGGIIFAGIMVIIGLSIVALALYNTIRNKPKLETDEKKRANGQQKEWVKDQTGR